MIERFQCLPHKITRRGFGMALGAAAGAEYLAKVKEAKAFSLAPLTVGLVPDPQNLADSATCSGATLYNGVIQWPITNSSYVMPDGQPLNFKGFISVGDCVNTGSSGSFNSGQQISVNAYAIAEANSKFHARCAGNHDYDTVGAGFNRASVSYMFRNDKNGAWSPTNVASLYSGGLDLGNGDAAYFGGAYADPTYPVSTANSYMRLVLGGRKILIINVEFFPRSAVMVWARGLHDSYPDHEVWVHTHGYQTNSGARCSRTDQWGNNFYTLGSAPTSNSGAEMWAGSDATWNGLTTWPNLTAVFCGHWIDGYSSPSASNWVYQRLASTSTSARAQTVQQIFCNCQGQSGSGDTTGSCGIGTADVAHLALLRIDPAPGTLKTYIISTNTGKWTGAYNQGGANTSPIELTNVSFPGIGRSLFPLPSPAGKH